MVRLVICILVLLGTTALVAEASQNLVYQPLVGIPGVDNASSNFSQYINQLYFLSISIAALLAVIKIIIGGVRWMLTGLVTSKEDAKNDIRSAVLGLLLIISAVLILGTINPQLTNLEMLRGADPVTLAPRTNDTVVIENPTQEQGQVITPENATGTQIAADRVACEGGGGSYQLRIDGRYSCITPTNSLLSRLNEILPGTTINQNIIANLTPHFVEDARATDFAVQDLRLRQGVPGATATNVLMVVQVPTDAARVSLVRESLASVCSNFGRDADVIRTPDNRGSSYFYCARP